MSIIYVGFIICGVRAILINGVASGKVAIVATGQSGHCGHFARHKYFLDYYYYFNVKLNNNYY